MRHILSNKEAGPGASRAGRLRAVLATAGLLAGAALVGCSDLKDNLLEAIDPDIIDPSSVQSAAGANAVRVGALARFRSMTTGSGGAGSEGTWLLGGLLADEWSTSSTFVQNDETDERQVSESNSSVEGSLRPMFRTRTAANQAIVLLNKYRPAPSSDIAEMYFIRGFAEMQLASDFCNGIPLTDAAGDEIVYDKGHTVAETFAVAISSLDSAINMTGTLADAANTLIRNSAKVAKARAQLGLNQAAAAGATVAGVPTTFTYDVTSSLTGGNNGLWGQNQSQRRYTVGDSLEGNDHKILVKNAIPFYSAKDPRVPVVYTITGGKDTTKGQDGSTFSRTTPIWGQTSTTTVANGVDARLIEAEAALAAGNPAGMISILNTLRATTIIFTGSSPQSSGTHPGYSYTANTLPPLTDPGTADARVSLLFRERAFWTFGRGERLGDLRRLIRFYGRTPDNTFPVGSHYRGGSYGADVNLPITTGEKNGNPLYTGCFDRKA
jgi:hypothetical protein